MQKARQVDDHVQQLAQRAEISITQKYDPTAGK